MRGAEESVDLRELAAGLRRGWWIVGLGAGLGLLLAGTAMLTVRPRYLGEATLLLRAEEGGAGRLISSQGSEDGVSLGGLADLFSLDSRFETELEILGSRALVGEVVDSLGLQARVLRPWRTGVDALVAEASYPRQLEEVELAFARDGDGYRVDDGSDEVRVRPGERFTLQGITLRLREDSLPDSFTLQVVGRQEAVARTLKALTVDRAAGDVAEIRYRASDPVSAAKVPNTMVGVYMARRETIDRSTNRRRYDFLAAHTDSIAEQLTRAAEELRRHQERSGVVDPLVQTEADVERSMALLARRQELEVDARALGEILRRGAEGTLDARAVASYPTLLTSNAVNGLLSGLADLEARRTELLDRRTEADPDVQLVEAEIRDTQGRILAIARSYHTGVAEQLAKVNEEIARSRADMATLPANAERSYLLQREVERLAQTQAALQTQLVQARIATIAEGGNLRQIDAADVPLRPLFPHGPASLGLGLFGGLFFGLIGALAYATAGRTVHDPLGLARISGLPVIALRPGAPLLLRGLDEARSLLVVACGRGADTAEAARRLAATATLRGRAVVLADLQEARFAPVEPVAAGTAVVLESALADSLKPVREPLGGPYRLFRANGNLRGGVRPLMNELEAQDGLLVVALPALDSAVSAALIEAGRPVVLVARAGWTRRAEVEGALASLQRLAVESVGVILAPKPGGRGL